MYPIWQHLTPPAAALGEVLMTIAFLLVLAIVVEAYIRSDMKQRTARPDTRKSPRRLDEAA